MSQSSEQGALRPEARCVECGHIRAGKKSGDMCMYPFVEGGPCTHRCDLPVPQTGSAVSPELLPCPFCGGEPEIDVHDSEYRDGCCFDIRCSPCGLQTGIGFYGKGNLVKWWNTRTRSDICAALVAENERLRARDAKSRESGCWCDEYGHPCKACENKQSLVEALKECLSFVESDYTGRGGKDLSGGAISRARTALAQVKTDDK